jgi:hypothetical protein
MALTREQFQVRLTESGIMSEEDLSAFATALPEEEGPETGGAEDPSHLAQALVAAERITPFQAEVLLAESKRPLRLGNYLLLDRVGSGGMGHVHKAVHERMNRIVALKVLPPTLAMDPDLVARFRREVQVAAKLHHPNIVTAYDADEADGVHFLVMELVEGRDLGVLVAAEGPCDIDQAMDYIEQAARALAYAHGEGVLHRDVKPANLLVDDEGCVKVLDMGLARLEASDGLTTTGDVIGTAATMAPEQGEDIRLVDERSDVYGLGCTLFFLLTGAHMYEGDSAIQVLLAHARSPVPVLSDVRPEVPGSLQALFESMVQKRREDRLPNMQAVMDGIAAIRAGQAPALPTLTSAGTRAPPARGLPMWLLGLLAGVVLVAGGLFLWLGERASGPGTEEAEVQGPPVLQPLRALRGHGGSVHAVAFHPDGKRVLTGSSDNTIGVWSLESGALLFQLEGHTDSVRGLLCLRDGKTLISSSDDATIRIWDLPTRSQRQVLRGHENKVRTIALAPDESWLVSAGKDGTLRIWDLPAGVERLQRDEHESWVGSNRGFLSVAVRPDGGALASAAFDRTVRLWDTETFQVRKTLGPHPSDVGMVRFSADGRFLLYDLEAGQVRVMTANGARDVTRLVGHEDWIYSIAACPGRPIAATGSEDTTIKLWEIESGTLLATLVGHEFTVGALAFSADGRFLLSGSGDDTAQIWDVAHITHGLD